ncbi:IPT/TIG domain-containing protein [Mucilaginibacter ginsenosidivorax]|uniref:T9SS type A sorting domain-containing protein n=1 Tax=Mucilaginibacter ginsenosidivorax TaxID=862126 RepID=A0A5B8W8R7_9SPHI|nr:IPT/TIG domain-containing protein [Mucilaginibacter ginsenosidivorax]QEC79292.1 T9SS type A sorting domain-containing protein [Mucilaginibacter ginsenosidivorax]
MKVKNFRKCLTLLPCAIFACLNGYSQAPNITYTTPAPYKTGTAITPLSPQNSGKPVPAVSYASVTPFAGGSLGWTDGSGTAAQFNNPAGVALDASGNLYIAENSGQRIRKATPAGIVSTIAGTYRVAGSADGPGSSATFNSPYGVAVDAAGNIYISETAGRKIRKITPAGVVSTFAGSGTKGVADGTGTAASFNVPEGLCFDKSGNLYVADIQNNNIRKITPAGVVSTFAGSTSGTPGAANGLGTTASFFGPTGIVADATGNLYVTDAGNHKIRKITAAGAVSDLVGDGTANWRDGTGTSAALNDPYAIAIDELGNLYEAEYYFSLVRKITPAGVITTIAGNGIEGSASAVGNAATFNDVKGMACDGHGNLYIGEGYNSDVRKMSIWGYSINPALPNGLTFDGTSGTISGTPLATSSLTVYTITAYNAGGSSTATVGLSTVLPASAPTVTSLAPVLASAYSTINITGNNLLGATAVTVGGVPAKSFTPVSPTSLNVTIPGAATSGTIKITTPYGSVTANGFTLLKAPKISYSQPPAYVTGKASTTLSPANTGGEVPKTGYRYVSLLAGNPSGGSNDGTGKAAGFKYPYAGVCDLFGNLYVADITNGLIRKVTPDGVVTTFAGGGHYPNDGTGKTAGFYGPAGITIDAAGNLYVADGNDQLIRKITPAGVVTTLAGSGRAGSKDGKGVYAWFSGPVEMGIDALWNLYCGEFSATSNLRKITTDGVVTTVDNSFNGVTGITTDDAGNLYIADQGHALVKKMTPAGSVSIFTGSGKTGKADGTPASASFTGLSGLAADHFGNIYACETGNNQLRMIDPAGNVSTIAPLPKILDSYFYKPNGICADGRGNIYIFNGDNTIRKMSLTGYSISPDLPAGLNFDASTGTISGTPTTASALTSYVITAFNTSGNSTYTLKFAVTQGNLAIKSFKPASAAKGVTVTITGSNLGKVTGVRFGSIAAASFKVVNDTTVTAVVGTGATGNVTLTTAADSTSKAGFTFAAPVSLSGFTPMTAARGATVKLSGSNFTSATAVSFGGTAAASFKIVSDTLITAVVGTGATGAISVTSPGGSAILPGFKFIAAPVTTSFSPLNAASGTTVTITGTGFTGATAVSFGGVAAASFSVTSDTGIKAVIGQGASGNIVITTPGGTSTFAGFKFISPTVVTAFTPLSASTGDKVTITGTGFGGVSAVSFGDIPAYSYTLNADNSITAVIGQGASGNIKVTTPGGTGTLGGFKYIPAPAITSFSPASATKGTSITIAGTNFTGATSVSFGGVAAASYVVNSDNSITAVIGSAASGTVTVTTRAGTATVSGFTFIPVPAIISFTPSSAATGDVVTITGSGFNGATAVSFGGAAAASFVVNADNSITAVVDKGATGSISVKTAGGTAILTGFTYYAPPAIASFTPLTATNQSTVTITGTGFTGTTAVSFGGMPAASFTVVSATSIKAVTGDGSSGAVSVTTPYGTGTKTGFNYVPQPLITAGGPTTFSSINGSVTLTASPANGYTYQWFKDGTAIKGATGATYTAAQTGAYTVKITLNAVTRESDAIDVNAVFMLPVNNFQLTYTSASCKGSANGSVNITAAQTLNYLATITGNGISNSYPFTTGTVINNLAAGTYNICITVSGEPTYQQCFTAVITEPKDLSLYTSVGGSNQVTLNLDGGTVYTIKLNGLEYTTTQSQVTLPLNTGSNRILVSTDRLCQGVIERVININNALVIYPNPFNNNLNLDIGKQAVKNATVTIYAITNGKVVYSNQYTNPSEMLHIDLSALKNGIYMLKLSADGSDNISKIIKQ